MQSQLTSYLYRIRDGLGKVSFTWRCFSRGIELTLRKMKILISTSIVTATRAVLSFTWIDTAFKSRAALTQCVTSVGVLLDYRSEKEWSRVMIVQSGLTVMTYINSLSCAPMPLSTANE